MKRLMTMVALVFIGASVNAQCNDLFFSEYIEGSSSNKALEIFNPTAADIDLSDYVIYRANNGSLTPTDSLFPAGMITSMDVYVVGNPGANPTIQAESDTLHSLTFYNGDDAVYMIKISTGDTLDIIGEIGVDPGSGWPVGSGATNNFTLIRQISIQEGELNWTVSTTEWDVFPIDMDDSLGFHTFTPCASIGSCSNDIFFSEYIEGSSSNKAFEIYNPLDTDVDLSNYVIYRNNNGSVTPSDSLFPVGILMPDSVFVVANSSANAAIMAEEDTLHTMTFYNGDDAMYLVNQITGDTVDLIGEIGVDPGSGWTVGTGATNNFTLIRMTSVTDGTNNWAIGQLQWDVYPIDMTDSLGQHTMAPCAACTPTTSTITETACDSYTSPDGGVYTTSGSYTATIPNSVGCDSIITINLTVNYASTNVLNELACGSYTLNGTTYTSSGTFIQTMTNAVGCDSIITLNLDITPLPAAPTVNGTLVYCDGDTPTALTVPGTSAATDSLIISGVVDATLTGGQPKAVEFYVVEDIADLSTYGFGSANNGGGTDGEEFTFPAIAVTAGTYIHVTTDSANFVTYFGFAADYVSSSAINVNGDDAVELFHNGTVIDVFGDINTDGTGQPWEYLDGWAYRNINSTPNGGTWTIGEWTFSGINALDGTANNAAASSPWPIETFTYTPPSTEVLWYSDPGLGAGSYLDSGSFTPPVVSGTTSYYVALTNVGGTNCQGPATQVDVTFNALPTVTANASTTTLCEGEDLTLTGSGASTYTWNNGVTDGAAFPATTSMYYVVIGIDTNNCSNVDSVNITVTPAPSVSFGALTQLCVYDGAITLSQGSPAGGTYSGNGVSGTSFDPATAGGGTHTLTYTYSDGTCSNSATSDIIVDSCLAINEIDFANIEVYPNPTHSTLTVESSYNINEIGIVSISGELIKVVQEGTFSVEELENGIYVLRIRTAEGIVNKRFVKK